MLLQFVVKIRALVAINFLKEKIGTDFQQKRFRFAKLLSFCYK